MVQNDHSYDVLFLLPNKAGFALTYLFKAIFKVTNLEIYKDRNIRSNVSNPMKLFSTLRFYSFNRDYKIAPFNVIKFNLSLTITLFFIQVTEKIVDVLSSKKLNIETHKSEK